MHGFQLHEGCTAPKGNPTARKGHDGNSYSLEGKDGIGGLCTSKSAHVTARARTLLKHLEIIEGSSQN